jgi:hypothetical protein
VVVGKMRAPHEKGRPANRTVSLASFLVGKGLMPGWREKRHQARIVAHDLVEGVRERGDHVLLAWDHVVYRGHVPDAVENLMHGVSFMR